MEKTNPCSVKAVHKRKPEMRDKTKNVRGKRKKKE